MEDLKQFKCKTCGEMLDVTQAHDGVLTCVYCGGTYVLPKEDSTAEVRMLLIEGEHDLDTGKFDDAKSAYSKVIEKDPDEPEAYWGMALANNGIQYLLDEKVENILGGNSKRLQPICHRIDDEKFTDDPYYNKALDCATPDQRTEYEKRAAEIDHIKREFYRLKQTGLDYDCFICVKVSKNTVADPSAKTAETEKTEDSVFAHKIYKALAEASYTPFYSEAVLKEETGADYEAHILYALATSETMLVVCFDESYLDTKWVKNEYSRFLKLVNDEEKESDSITVVYKGKPIEKLPGKKGKIQGIDAGAIDYYHRILKFVDSHTPETQRKRAEAKQRAEEEAKRRAEEERQRAEELNRLKEDARKRDEEFSKLREEMTKRAQSETVVSGPTVETLLKRARQEIKLENYDEAKNYYRRILESNPENATAWYGLMMLGFDCRNDDELAEKLANDNFYNIFNRDKNVNMVREYADSAMQERLKKLFAKRKQVLKDKVSNAEHEIEKTRGKITEAEKEIDYVNDGINAIESQVDERNGELNAKQTELTNLNAVLSEKRREAEPHQKKADSARRKKGRINTIDHLIVAEDFLSDFWLDEGDTFTLANVWDGVFDKASDFREWTKDHTSWPCLVKIIFFSIWLGLQFLSLFAYPLAFIVIIIPFVVIIGIISLVLLVLSVPVNLFILLFNIIGKIRETKLTNEASLEQKQADNILREAKTNVDNCNREIDEIYKKIETLRGHIRSKERNIEDFRRQIGSYESDISAYNRQIDGWKDSLAKC